MSAKTAPAHGTTHGDSEGHHGHVSKATYYRVFAALMLLMILTVAVYYGEDFLETQGIVLPGVLVVGIAMSIAVAKTALIVLYFMHVKVSSKVAQIFAAASFVWLLLLFVITMGDYAVRDWPPQLDGPLSPTPGPAISLILALFS
jgi:cytochrome c oxidase subunit IV